MSAQPSQANGADGADDAVVPRLGRVIPLAGAAMAETLPEYPSGTVHYHDFAESKPAGLPRYEAFDMEDCCRGTYNTLVDAVADQLGATASFNNHHWQAPDDEVFISAWVWQGLTDAEKLTVRAMVARVYVPDAFGSWPAEDGEK